MEKAYGHVFPLVNGQAHNQHAQVGLFRQFQREHCSMQGLKIHKFHQSGNNCTVLYSFLPFTATFTCVVIDCGSLEAPRNGSVTFFSTTYSSVANISCDDGYILIGENTSTCTQSGVWSNPDSECRRKLMITKKKSFTDTNLCSSVYSPAILHSCHDKWSGNTFCTVCPNSRH